MNPLFESFKRQSGQTELSGGFSLQSMLQKTFERFVPPGMTPEQVVRQKIQNREMTQEQFEHYKRMAEQLLGRNRR